MFQYNPKDAMLCWPEGGYDATIDSYEVGDSKSSGNEMLTVVFEVYHESKTMKLKDYIVNPSTLFKLRKIATALGKRAVFDKGEFNIADHLGESIRLNLEVEESDEFGDRNVIRGYAEYKGDSSAPRKKADAPKPDANHEPLDDSDIPFD